MTDPNNNTHIDTLQLDPADGQQYLDELSFRLFELLLACQTIEDVDCRLRKLYPNSKLVDLAIQEANKSRAKSLKNHKIRHHSSSSGASFTGALHNLTSFAVAKVSNLLREGVVSKSENEVSKYKGALIQFILDDVVNLAGDFVRRQKGNFIVTRSDMRTAMHADKDLLDMFLSDDKSSMIQNHPILARISAYANEKPALTQNTLSHHQNRHTISSLKYKQKVRDMVDSENSNIRKLKLLIKVFKSLLQRLPETRREVDIIFCNVEDLVELSTLLLTALEDALENVDPEAEEEIPFVGSEILDLAQAEEFHAYFTFAYKRLSRNENWRSAYNKIINDESTMTSIRTAGQSFDLAVRYILPNYLTNTIIQFFEFYKNVCDLFELSKTHNNFDDQLALKETISILIKTKKAIEDILESEMDEEEIEPLDPKQSESIRVFLERRLEFELQHERTSPLPYMPPPEIYRFSEPDSKDNIQFEDVHNRTISSKDIERSLMRNENDVPVIRCATLIKLVERLTYHKYQPTIVDCFLTTYRSFLSDPEELLDLLIERFRIPDPPISVVYPNFNGSPDDLPECDRNAYKQYLKRFRQEYSKPVKMRVINVLKSWIKNHYYDFERHPTLLDKLNSFLDEVYQNDKVLRSLINSLKKSIEQKKISQSDEFEFMLSKEPPPILWSIAKPNESEKFDLLTLHPREFARQLTLIEFELFRAIKPSELINVRDFGLRTKKDEDKYESSPNLSRMTRHFTLLSYWLRKYIVDTEDLEKRGAIFNRAIEIMGALRELNNFTGLLSIGSAIESAPIVRLAQTRKTLSTSCIKIMEDYRDLNKDHQKRLQFELKSCNPPCIPYLGSYQTKLIHAKEGNRTFIDDVDTISPTLSNDSYSPVSPQCGSTTEEQTTRFFGGRTAKEPRQSLINFTKQLIRAKLVGEISNYQNQPYCLTVQEDIRNYIESEISKFTVDDIPSLTKRLDDYLFQQSEKIEPKKPARSSKSKDFWKSPGRVN